MNAVRRRRKPDPSHHGPWPMGSTIIYADGRRVKIVNYPKINGLPGIQLDVRDALFVSDRFKLLADVVDLVTQGVWKVERPQEGSGSHAS